MTGRVVTERATTHRGRVTALSVLMVFALVGCGKSAPENAASLPSAVSSSTTSATSVPHSSNVDAAGAELSIRFLQGLSRDWNESALTWVYAYSDPQVSWEEFLRIQHEVLVAQTRTVATARLQTSQLPPDVQGPAEDIIAHYQDRLEAFDEWARAIIQGDINAEESAATAYNAISNTSTIRPLLENLFDAPTIRYALEADGVTSEDLLAAFLGAVPNG